MWTESAGAHDGFDGRTVATYWPAAFGPGEKLAAIVRCVDGAHHTQHRPLVVHQADRDGVAAVPALHRRGAVVRIDNPHRVLGALGGPGFGFLAEIAPRWERA